MRKFVKCYSSQLTSLDPICHCVKDLALDWGAVPEAGHGGGGGSVLHGGQASLPPLISDPLPQGGNTSGTYTLKIREIPIKLPTERKTTQTKLCW